MKRGTRVLLAFAVLAVPMTSMAQYRRTAQDTVRLREVTTGSLQLTMQGSVMRFDSEHEGFIALVHGSGDAARAWYERLHIAMNGPQGRVAPATDSALFQPFDLLFDERGRITTVRAPKFPLSFETVTDLSHQFDDLFLRLPVEPLRLGLSWTDTATIESTGEREGRFWSQRQLHARVVRDTTVDREAGWVIEAVQVLSMRSSQRLRDQPLTARTQLAGADTGVFVFSRERGRMLGRRRRMTLTGTLTYEGGASPLVLPVRQGYENSVDVVRTYVIR